MYGVSRGEKPKELKLNLAKPNRQIIGILKDIYNKKLTLNFGKVHGISFTIPYYIDGKDGNKIKNAHLKNIKEKYLIKAQIGNIIQWYTISGIGKSSETSTEITVDCYSLEHQLNRRKMISYNVVSYNCLQVMTDTLKDTGWTIGYINPKFNLQHRSFDESSTGRLDFIYKIAETFEGIPSFDTINQKVSIYDKSEVSKYKGFNISLKNYLDRIEEKIDESKIITRLHVSGSDGLTITGVNPTGKSYIDDFSYFLYPFSVDDKGNITKHSAYMDDDLALALTKYNKFASDHRDDFRNYLNEKKDYQGKLTIENNKLAKLNGELQIILDSIVVDGKLGQSKTANIKQRDAKNNEIKKQKSVIEGINNSISVVDKKIEQLKKDMELSSHLSPSLLVKLQYFINEEEWSDENKIDENDLYEAGLEYLDKASKPPIDITIDIVNFFQIVSEKRNWDRLEIGDIIRVVHEELNIDIKAVVEMLEFDFEQSTIKVTISNLDELNSIKNKYAKKFYTIDKVNTDFNKRKIDYNKIAYNYNLRNGRYSEKPTKPTPTSMKHKENNDGSVNLILDWDYPDFDKTGEKADSIDGFFIYRYHSDDNSTYQFGSRMADESIVQVAYANRSYTFSAVPADLYYTIGIQAYRNVDEDVDKNGILLSDIVTFPTSDLSSMARGMALMSMSNEAQDGNDLTPPFKPAEEVNVNARLNGSKYLIQKEEPKNPKVNDAWVSTIDKKLRIWDGNSWGGDIQFDDIQNGIDKEISKIEQEIIEKIQDAMDEVDKRMEIVDEEMDRIDNEVVPGVEAALDEIDEKMLIVDYEVDRIENEVVPRVELTLEMIEESMKVVDDELNRIEFEVVPEVEKTIEETFVPKSDTPPEKPTGSGLYWDTSVEPPRMMRWNDVYDKWDTLAPTDDEVDDLIEQMRKDAILNSNQYTNTQIISVNTSISKLDNKIEFKAEQQEVDDLTGRIIDTEVTLKLLPDQLEAKVDADGLVNSINLSREGLKINANMIDIKGLVSFINSDGTAGTAIDGSKIVTGSITAKELNVNNIFANSAVVAQIQSGIVKTSELDATKIVTGTLDALKITVKNLSASSIISGTIDAKTITIKNINASEIVTGTLDALKVSVKNLSASSIISGELDAAKILVKNISATNITGGTLDALKVTVKNLSASSLIAGEINAKDIYIRNINASEINSGTLNANLVNVINLKAGDITVGFGTKFDDGYNPTEMEFSNKNLWKYTDYENVSIDTILDNYEYTGVVTPYMRLANWESLKGTEIYGKKILSFTTTVGSVTKEFIFNPKENGERYLSLRPNTDYTFSMDYYHGGGIDNVYFIVWAYNDDGTGRISYESGYVSQTYSAQFKHFKFRFKTDNRIYYETRIYVRPDKNMSSSTPVNFHLLRPMLAEGNTGSWSPAPEDNPALKWKYGDTTYIDGGNIYTNTISVNALMAGTIDANKLKISGGSGNSYIRLENNLVQMRGTYDWTWKGVKRRTDATVRIMDGHIRLRDETRSHSIYWVGDGFSTFIDGDGESQEAAGSSGTIQWWDTTYSPSGANGITMSSYSGAVALRSDNSHVVLDSNRGVDIKSQDSVIYITPRYNQSGNSDFWFNRVDGSSDGFLMFGSRVTKGDSGLRFSKSGNTISVVDGDYNRGGNTTFDVGNLKVNDITKRESNTSVYWNNTSGGTTTTENNPLRASGIRATTGSSDIFLATNDGGVVRITNEFGNNNGGNKAYRDIAAREFKPQSSEKYKKNIFAWSGSALEKIRQSVIYQYILKGDEKSLNRYGLIIERETPNELIDDDGILQYSMQSFAWRAIQELDEKITFIFEDIQKNTDNIELLRLENEILKQKVSQLEQKIA